MQLLISLIRSSFSIETVLSLPCVQCQEQRCASPQSPSQLRASAKLPFGTASVSSVPFSRQSVIRNTCMPVSAAATSSTASFPISTHSSGTISAFRQSSRKYSGFGLHVFIISYVVITRKSSGDSPAHAIRCSVALRGNSGFVARIRSSPRALRSSISLPASAVKPPMPVS